MNSSSPDLPSPTPFINIQCKFSLKSPMSPILFPWKRCANPRTEGLWTRCLFHLALVLLVSTASPRLGASLFCLTYYITYIFTFLYCKQSVASFYINMHKPLSLTSVPIQPHLTLYRILLTYQLLHSSGTTFFNIPSVNYNGSIFNLEILSMFPLNFSPFFLNTL